MAGLVGKGRDAIAMIVDPNSFNENIIGNYSQDPNLGPGAVIGTALINGKNATIISNDAMAKNKKFPLVYSGVIGLEEGYKMAIAVYKTIEADENSPVKRPLVLIVDTPGNGLGKIEEIFGMNKSTGSYQLALTEARQKGHPVIAVIIGRAISGAFLCHGLQADHIISLSKDFGTMIHVMPLVGIARITKMDIETLENLAKVNPVFAAGSDFFYKLGGVEEIIEKIEDIRNIVIKHINEVYALTASGSLEKTGPCSRGDLGNQRGGRKTRPEVLKKMYAQFDEIESKYL